LAGRYALNRIHVPGVVASTRTKLNMLPFSELLGKGDRRLNAELHWRLSFPISMVILSFLAVPLSHTSPRKGRFGKVAVAILLYVLYANLLGLGKNWLQTGAIPGWMGLWWIHVLFLMLFVGLMIRRGGMPVRNPFRKVVRA
ncbi:MAG TPA: LptF/LptG family permease, partial [Gammaproteobacteria bacterium]|nr:LptF/LptG family permease [Gammaproteobacteria bacterium]